MNHLKPLLFGLVIGLTLAAGLTAYATWSPPTELPPGCTAGSPGCDPPLTGNGTKEYLPFYASPGTLADSPLSRGFDTSGALVGLITDPGMGLVVDGGLAVGGALSTESSLWIGSLAIDALPTQKIGYGKLYVSQDDNSLYYLSGAGDLTNLSATDTSTIINEIYISSETGDAAARFELKNVMGIPSYVDQVVTFSTPGVYTWQVPAEVTSIQADIRGAQGVSRDGVSGGKGGRIQATVPVTQYENLKIYVGGIGPVYNASDIRRGGDALDKRIIVAGGGGFAGGPSYYCGDQCPENPTALGGAGGGGGQNGLPGSNGEWIWAGGEGPSGYGFGGGGATQDSGGATNQVFGTSGTFGLGGNGGRLNPYPQMGVGGRGGDGWYGGGGGGGGDNAGGGGGGGGSSYASSGISNVQYASGYQSGTGRVIITYKVPGGAVTGDVNWTIGGYRGDGSFRVSRATALGTEDKILIEDIGMKVKSGIGGGSVGALDIAELFPSTEGVFSGELIEATEEGKVGKTHTAYSNAILGVVSTNPAQVIEGDELVFTNQQYEHNPLKPAVALAGHVPVKVTDENGKIEIGDPITSSSMPGVGMKATKAGRVVGIALESYDKEEQGTILMFVNPHWYGGDAPSLLDSVVSGLKDKVVQAREVVADVIRGEKGQFKQGVELQDQETGEWYCMQMKKGELVSTAGECE
ncbi:MAG: hypothetical protein A3C04_03570 [Candidatus Wildermuthbacteria bacterium RIFCSPHIGHO2_02_FULL_45_25]|uniref:Peptidase G2 IMC autoproteolytic cleavage domain-containing protein n=1 Tax=Candidatus Wildermuthbacteria bacterium RIFCSPHIGHO2_02_FULL_45_25 TaxID=1802450 RepID=A0A1G2QYY9_9BACT|nr:MAG: hypothetical protein A3C04_03570 [Candidatus Wildermuthbacteria bacterium RIFCSPHIGHO2_02_FULL_45_25]